MKDWLEELTTGQARAMFVALGTVHTVEKVRKNPALCNLVGYRLAPGVKVPKRFLKMYEQIMSVMARLPRKERAKLVSSQDLQYCYDRLVLRGCIVPINRNN